jgi:hypothetical protein
MQLTYRGISYLRTHSTIPTTEMETRAKFRGQSYGMKAPISLPEQTQRTLIYRGISYTSGQVLLPM